MSNPNIHCNHVKEVPDGVLSGHISSLCPNGDGGCFACREIESLECEAEKISKKLANVLEKLINAKSARNHAHSTILAKLPNEILSYIFCAAWNAVDPSLPERMFGPEEPQGQERMSVALLLAGVCKKWRTIALSLPQIWSGIHVFIHRQHGHRALSILRDIVERSKRADLTVRLYSEDIDYSRIPLLQPALAILQKESKRWWSLQMCIPYQIVKNLFEPSMDLSRVYSLHVHSNQDYFYSSSSDPMWKDKCLRPQLPLAGRPRFNLDFELSPSASQLRRSG